MTGTQGTGPLGGPYDVVVVGGGIAGLSGALVLARARRSVLVVDAGEPRNAPAAHSQGFLTRDGTPPGELLRLGRAEIEGYGVQVRPGRAISAQPLPDGGFAVQLDDGGTVRARRLLVTTGVVDELPSVPGVRERWGRDVIHCPYCHGWEVRDQAIAVLATGARSVHQALLFGQWTGDVTLFLHTGPQPAEEEWEQLAARGVRVVDGEVAALEVANDRITGVRLASGQVLPTRVVVVGPRVSTGGGVLASLGVLGVEHPMGIGTQVPVGVAGLTSVPGVWAAGNVADLTAGLVQSAAAGSTSAAAINWDLVTEEVSRAVAGRFTGNNGSYWDHEQARWAVREHTEAVHGAPDQVDSAGDDAITGEAFWEDLYRANPTTWSGRPNPQLVAETADLRPGTALDVGCGEGGDAIWLAQRGWQVTAVDISPTALGRASANAAQAGPEVSRRITWLQADLINGPLPDGSTYDLVTAQFIHLPSEQRRALHVRLAAAVSVGGTLLVVGHDPSDPSPEHGPGSIPDLRYTAEQVGEVLDLQEWEVLVSEARARVVAHGHGAGGAGSGGEAGGGAGEGEAGGSAGEGGGGTIHDAVLTARRRAVR